MTIQESEELPRSTMAAGSSESLGLSAFVRSMVRSITGLGIILASKLDTVSLKVLDVGRRSVCRSLPVDHCAEVCPSITVQKFARRSLWRSLPVDHCEEVCPSITVHWSLPVDRCNNYNHVELQNRFDRFSPAKFFLVSTFPHFLFPVSWFPIPAFISTP